MPRYIYATNRLFPSLGLGFKIQGFSLNTVTNSLGSDSGIHSYIDRETERHRETYIDTDTQTVCQKDKHMLTCRVFGHSSSCLQLAGDKDYYYGRLAMCKVWQCARFCDNVLSGTYRLYKLVTCTLL